MDRLRLWDTRKRWWFWDVSARCKCNAMLDGIEQQAALLG
jgi:hypothetical protein